MPVHSGNRIYISPAVEKIDLVLEWTGWLSLALLWFITLRLWVQLPEQIPIHFDMALRPDAYGDKNELLVLALVGSALFLGMTMLNKYPHYFNYPVPITPENAKSEYTKATRVLRLLKLIILWAFGGLALLSSHHAQSAQIWVSSGDKSMLLEKTKLSKFRGERDPSAIDILLLPEKSFQRVEGFGAALTGSSAFILQNKMNSKARAKTLKALFNNEKGIGISYMRLTMGASDFSLADFTYNDLPSGDKDFDLVAFSLSQDTLDIIPVMKEIMRYQPRIQIMATPWSPPAWMKTNGRLAGGKLRTECYGVYAQYFVRYIAAMQAKGIPIHAVTPQNEPLHFSALYPCMEMQASEQAIFIKNHLGPAFKRHKIPTLILVHDHNWDRPDYPLSILDDPEANPFIAGTAFHAYAGNPDAMGLLQRAHPEKGLYFTEISGGSWAPDFSDNLMWYLRNVFIGSMQQNARTVLFWNLILDEKQGPKNKGCQDCRGVLTLLDNGSIQRNEEYYALAHFSKFVRPGALRIDHDLKGPKRDIGIIAFKNPGGQLIAVVVNFEYTAQMVSLAIGNDKWRFELPPRAVATWTNQY
jgi:glucosylceramidase